MTVYFESYCRPDVHRYCGFIQVCAQCGECHNGGGGFFWSFEVGSHRSSGSLTVSPPIAVFSYTGKMLVNRCHSIFGLKSKPISASGSPNLAWAPTALSAPPVMVFCSLALCLAAKYCR